MSAPERKPYLGECSFCGSEVEVRDYTAPPFSPGRQPGDTDALCHLCANTAFSLYGPDSCGPQDVAKLVAFVGNEVLKAPAKR